MTTGTAGVKDFAGLRRFSRIMFMAFMTGLYRRISRLEFVMTGGALGDTQISMHFMRKSHCTQFGFKLNYFLICRDNHLSSNYVADKT